MARWVLGLGLGLIGCDALPKNGGVIDTDSGSSDGGDDSARSCDAEAVCGNGVIEALEECDGGPGCADCRDAVGANPIGGSDEIGGIAFAADGSWLVATARAGGDPFVRRFDAAGIELWSHALVGIAHSPLGVALDSSGRAYFAGSTRDEAGDAQLPTISAWDATGAPQWTVEDVDLGVIYSIAVSDDRIAVVGSQFLGDDVLSRIRLLDHDGVAHWDLGDDAFDRLLGVTFAGSDVVVTGGRDVSGAVDQIELRRYDDLATARWSIDLPTDAAQLFHSYRVTGDGTGGTWTFGTHDLSPYIVHHDAEGTELEVLDCFGLETSHLLSLAVGDDGRLALGVGYSLGEIPPFEQHAWFAVVQDGVVTSATAPGVDTTPAGVAWVGDRPIVAWTNNVDGHSTVSLRP